MANETMVLIETKTVGSGGAGTIDFTSIPATFTDLKVVLSTRADVADDWQNLFVAINGSSTNFTRRELYDYNQGAGEVIGSSNATTGHFGSGTQNNTTVNTFGITKGYFPNYAGSNNKVYSVESIVENNSSQTIRKIIAGQWASTSAITSLSFSNTSGNFKQYSSASLYGIKKGGTGTVTPVIPKATGGTVYYTGGYFYHKFTTSGTFTPTQSLTADVLMVAGGGGGGGLYRGGGGGAGGVVYSASQSLTATGYTVTVGAGGSQETNGSNTTFTGLTNAVGGGRGDGGVYGTGAASGGSGGGGRGAATNRYGGSGTAGQGNAGGNNIPGELGGAGGGGAGAAGQNSPSGAGSTPGGYGGDGTNTYSSWATATSSGASGYYAGGGGGGTGNGNPTTGNGGAGGAGGGGQGAGVSGQGYEGSANTGGGGGGGGNTYSSNSGNGFAGGSGIVIVRYAA